VEALGGVVGGGGGVHTPNLAEGVRFVWTPLHGALHGERPPCA